MKYDAVIFDLFGTLIDNYGEVAFKQKLTEMADVLGVPPQDFIQEWGKAWKLRSTGELSTIEESIKHAIIPLGVQASSEQIAEATRIRFAFTQSMLVPRHDTLETLQELRSSGYKIGLISDCTAEVPLLWPETPFVQFIDVPIFSCAVHLKKPDPRIYLLACERLGVLPQRCLFVGDGGSRELNGANAVGMDALMIRAESEQVRDVHRLEADVWEGSRVITLKNILPFVDDKFNGKNWNYKGE
jgi:putative hydrolase of the HAD superfamily